MTLIVIGALLWAGLFVYNFFFSDGVNQRRFKSELWKQSEPEYSHSSMRLRMADNLVAKHLATGMTRDEVVELLGPPEETDYFHHYEMVYFLGLERGFMAIDGEWLVINLDESEVVTDFRLARD